MSFKKTLLIILSLYALNAAAQIFVDTVSYRRECLEYSPVRINKYNYLYYYKKNTVELVKDWRGRGSTIYWDTTLVKNLVLKNDTFSFDLKYPTFVYFSFKICDSLNNCNYYTYNILKKDRKVAYLIEPNGYENTVLYEDDVQECCNNVKKKQNCIGVMANDSILTNYKVTSFCLNAYYGIGDGIILRRYCSDNGQLDWDMLHILASLRYYNKIFIDNILIENITTGEKEYLPPLQLMCK